jgi:hypothetical protein
MTSAAAEVIAAFHRCCDIRLSAAATIAATIVADEIAGFEALLCPELAPPLLFRRGGCRRSEKTQTDTDTDGRADATAAASTTASTASCHRGRGPGGDHDPGGNNRADGIDREQRTGCQNARNEFPHNAFWIELRHSICLSVLVPLTAL